MKQKAIIILFLLQSVASTAQTWKELSDSLIAYYAKKDYIHALPWAQRATVATKEKFGAQSNVYASYLTMLAGLYVNTSRPAEAIAPLEESLILYRKNVGEDHKDYIKTMSVLAVTYSTIGQDNKAEPLLFQLTTIYKKNYGSESEEYAGSLNKLAKVYEQMGRYASAEPLFIDALAIRKKLTGEKNEAYANSLNNLALLYKSMGEYDKAETLLLKAMSIRKDNVGEQSTDYANSLSNLSSLYMALGDYEKAEPMLLQASAIFKLRISGNYSNYATTLANLALLYQDIGKYRKADSLFTQALSIQEKIFGKEHPEYLLTLNSQAMNYQLTGQDEKGEQTYLAVIQEQKKGLGEKHPDYIRSLNNLAYLYGHEKKYKKAEELYTLATDLFKQSLGTMHPDYAASLNNLAVLYEATGEYARAEPLLLEAVSIEKTNLTRLFGVMTETERANYITQQITLIHTFNSFLYNYPQASASFYKASYELQLLLKGLSFTDTKNALETVRNSRDTIIRKTFSSWKQNKIVLAKQYSLPIKDRRPDLKVLEEETEQLEKNLDISSALFRRQHENTGVKWNEVQQHLQNDEVALEFVSFELYNNGWTDTMLYVAYLIRKNDTAPKFVVLTSENRLQQLIDSAGKDQIDIVNNFYRGLEGRNNNSSRFLGSGLYQQIWAPLEPYLKGIRRISYSPSGKLYNIAFNALATTDSGQLLTDRYQLDQYGSTKQLVQRAESIAFSKPSSIALFGNASFTLDSVQLVKQRGIRLNDSLAEAVTHRLPPRGMDGFTWSALSGTGEEIKKISDLFKKQKLGVTYYAKAEASEGHLKALEGRSPQIIHIATHGYFLPGGNDTLRKEAGLFNQFKTASNPLLRTGLIFAGANYVWSGKKPVEGIEDGIATAYEISQLDLNTTELVVLSACETGLGDIKGSEGVFGLQRAFRMAGVKKLIVSLWQVPDKETSELMTLFYSNWLKGSSIRDAFSKAQKEMRKKYTPYYWAAFVLIE